MDGPEKGGNIAPDASGGDQADYRQKLQQIRHTYHSEMTKYEDVRHFVIFKKYSLLTGL